MNDEEIMTAWNGACLPHRDNKQLAIAFAHAIEAAVLAAHPPAAPSEATLREALLAVHYSMKMASIPGNDVRREIALTLNIVDQLLAAHPPAQNTRPCAKRCEYGNQSGMPEYSCHGGCAWDEAYPAEAAPAQDTQDKEPK